MKIGLFYNNSNFGPGKVVQNLIQGIDELKNNEICHNQFGDLNGSLNVIRFDLPLDTYMGPNLVILPNDNDLLFKSYQNIIVPSKWVYDKYKSFDFVRENHIYIWSVGIDTDKFNDCNKSITKDCFIYYKNRKAEDLIIVQNILDRMQLAYEVIKYGEYNEDKLIEITKKCRFCIMLDNTESQGIATMEILSSDVPCFVINKNIWDHYPDYRFNATSVPYFDERCGMVINSTEEMNQLSLFISRLNNYNPRSYIIENHTLAIGASNYLKILGGF